MSWEFPRLWAKIYFVVVNVNSTVVDVITNGDFNDIQIVNIIYNNC